MWVKKRWTETRNTQWPSSGALIVHIPIIEGSNLVPDLKGLWVLDPWCINTQRNNNDMYNALVNAVGGPSILWNFLPNFDLYKTVAK